MPGVRRFFFVHEAWNRSAHTRVVLIFDAWNPDLAAAEREALAAGIAAIGEFHRRHGGADPTREPGTERGNENGAERRRSFSPLPRKGRSGGVGVRQAQPHPSLPFNEGRE